MSFFGDASSPMSTKSSDRKILCCDCRRAFTISHKAYARALEIGYFRCETCFQMNRRSR